MIGAESNESGAEIRRSESDAGRASGSALFPVTRSIVSAEAVRRQIAQTYPIATPVTCYLLEAGPNDTYLLTGHTDRYIARVYGSRSRSLSEIAYELELLNHLADRGISISAPIPSRDGTLIHPLEAPEGTRHLVLFTYAEGAPFSWSGEHSYLAGQILAAIHAASDIFVSQHHRFRWDLENLIEAPLAAIRPFLARRPDDCSDLEGFAGRLRARAEAAIRAGLDWGVCHGDYGGNIHIAADSTLTVFDFDLCGPGWRAYDLVVFKWGATSRKRDGIWDLFLKGYTEKRHLAVEDLMAVPLFQAIRHLWTLGLRISQVDQHGALSVGDSYLDYRLASFRRWEGRYAERMGASKDSGHRAAITAPDTSDAGQTSGFGLFPVTYSTLAACAVRAQIAQAYPIDAPVACHLLRRGLHDTYVVTARDDHYIARVYRACLRTSSDIAYELDFVTYLAAQGASVSVPFAARDGALSRLLPMPEGTRHLVLFTYAAGTRLSWKDRMHCYLAGRTLATIHALSDGFVSRHARVRLDLEYLIDAPLAALRPLLVHRSDDWNYLQRLGDNLRARAEAAIRVGLDWGVCHGDYGAKNLHITEDQILTVFDFERCGPGWRAYDFALIQWGAMASNKNHMWDAFVNGYTDTRQLAAPDLAAVPLFHALSHLSSLGIFAANVTDWGNHRMSDWLIDRELTFFRQWEVDHGERA